MAKAKKAPEGAETPQPKKKGSLLKKIILLVVVLLVLGGGGLYVYLEFFDQSVESEGHAEKPSKKEKEGEGVGHMMHLETFLVNLADSEGRRYLKVKIDLEVAGEKELKELEKVNYKIRDAVILILSTKTFKDVASAEGKQNLRQEILEKLKILPGGKKITGAYFTEFVAQ